MNRFYRLSQLVTSKDKSGITPFSSATIWRLAREGKFPAPTKLSENVTVWDAEAVDAWLAKKLEVQA